MNILSSLSNSMLNQTPVHTPTKTPVKTPKKSRRKRAVQNDEETIVHQGPIELLQGANWREKWCILYKDKVTFVSDYNTPRESRRDINFTIDTRLYVPLSLNMRPSDAASKGRGMQIETPTQTLKFIVASRRDLGMWARTIGSLISEFKKENSLFEIVAPVDDAEEDNAENSFLLRKHTQSVRSTRTMSRTSQAPPVPHFATPSKAGAPSKNRSRQIQSLQAILDKTQAELKRKEKLLDDAEQYRETITKGTIAWKKQFVAGRNQKLADTQERLREESESVVRLRKQNNQLKTELEQSKVDTEALTEAEEELEAERANVAELRENIQIFKDKLKRELAFAIVLEADTKALSEKLVRVNEDLRERDQQVVDLKLRNQELELEQENMQREFFFSMAISIKLALAQQGVYSNANLNDLFEQISSIRYSDWHDWISSKLGESQISVTPTPTPAKSPKKKRGFSFFGN